MIEELGTERPGEVWGGGKKAGALAMMQQKCDDGNHLARFEMQRGGSVRDDLPFAERCLEYRDGTRQGRPIVAWQMPHPLPGNP